MGQLFQPLPPDCPLFMAAGLYGCLALRLLLNPSFSICARALRLPNVPLKRYWLIVEMKAKVIFSKLGMRECRILHVNLKECVGKQGTIIPTKCLEIAFELSKQPRNTFHHHHCPHPYHYVEQGRNQIAPERFLSFCTLHLPARGKEK